MADVSIARVKMGEDTLRVRASGSLTGLGVSRKNFGGERVTLDVKAIEFEAYYATESEDDLGGELDLSNDEAFDEPIIDGEINLVRPREPPARQPATRAPASHARTSQPRTRPARAHAGARCARPARARLGESQRADAHPGRASWSRSSSRARRPS